MANYRVINPVGDITATEDFENADEAYSWFINSKADNTELGWRLEVEHDGEWAFVDDSEGISDPKAKDGPPSV